MQPDRFALTCLLLIASAVIAEPAVITRHFDHTSDRTPSHTVAPEYPRIARRDRIEGTVLVCYHIDKKGRPYRVAVRESTHRLFERPVIRAIRASSYKPLQNGQEASPMKTCRTFRFELTPAVANDVG